MSIGLTHYLLLAAMLFAIGMFGVLSKRNIIAVLMGIELMLNAVNINLVAFNRFMPGIGWYTRKIMVIGAAVWS